MQILSYKTMRDALDVQIQKQILHHGLVMKFVKFLISSYWKSLSTVRTYKATMIDRNVSIVTW